MERLEEICDDVHLDLDVDEGLAAEILLRLPARPALRFRAVCEEWLRIFVAQHARRPQPLQVLLYTRTKVGPDAVPYVELHSQSVTDHLPAPPPPRRPLARFPEKVEPWDERSMQYCRLVGSCDGLLLFATVAKPASTPCRYMFTNVREWVRPWLGIGRHVHDVAQQQQYLICNPATRQWSELSRLTTIDEEGTEQREAGFYFDEPSGEYRLLCYVSGQAPYYRVFSTGGAEEPRRLGVQAAAFPRAGNDSLMAQAILNGHLHWLNGLWRSPQMLAFDTVAETFRWMAPPPVTRKDNTNLFVADGSLVASEMSSGLGQSLVDLWVLEGYGGTTERWERRHRVRVEVLCPTGKLQLAAGGDGGDVILGTTHGVVTYNMRSGTVRKVVGRDASRGDDDPVLPSRSVFRESLVRHVFFEARPHPGVPLFKLLCS